MHIPREGGKCVDNGFRALAAKAANIRARGAERTDKYNARRNREHAFDK